MTYAGFWPRFAAMFLDGLFLAPLTLLTYWGYEHSRLFELYNLLPGILLGLWYYVYLVRRFGGTPGKRVMKIRIVKVSGAPVTYREAFLRYLPDSVICIGTSLALIMAVLSLTDAQYFAATTLIEREEMISKATPNWNDTLTTAEFIWFWSELIVMLTNKKRRALHDLIAGTVVIKDPDFR